MTSSRTQPRTGRTTPVFRGRLARRMILLLVPAVLLPVIVMGWLLTQRTQQLLQRQISSQLQQAEDNMRGKIDEWLLAKSTRLNVIAHRQPFAEAAQALLSLGHYDPKFQAAQQQAIAELSEINRHETHPLFNNFILLASDYSVLASSNSAWMGLQLRGSPLAQFIDQINRAQPPAELAWLGSTVSAKAAFTPDASGAVHFLIPNYAPLPSEKQRTLLFTVMPYTDPQSQKRLYIVGISEELALEHLITDLANRYPSSTGYFLLYDGTYLTIDPATNTLLTHQAPPDLLQSFSAQHTLTATASYRSPLLNKPAFSVAQWIPDLNAAIGLEIPSALLTERSRQLLPYATKLFIFTAIFIAAVIWLMATYISRPVLRIAEAARRFAEGDWQIRSPVTRNDEIGLLAHTFNQMADELSEFYRSLEQQVKERTEQIRTASEVAALATSATDLNEILRRTVNLITERFPQYYHASVFLIDENTNDAVLEASTGPIGEQMKKQGHRLSVGGQSVVGWAAYHRQPRIASDVMEDPIHFKNPLLPETRSEAAIPIIIGNQVLGVLDVQSKNPHAFDEQSVATLQTLARQLAAAIYNARLREQAETGLGETQMLYHLSSQLAAARTEADIIAVSTEALRNLPFISGLFVNERENNIYRLLAAHHPNNPEMRLDTTQSTLRPDIVKQYLPDNSPLVFNDLNNVTIDNPLTQMARAMGCASVAYLTISLRRKPVAIIMLGSERTGTFTAQRLQPYTTLAEIAGAALERTMAIASAERRLQELRVMVRLSQSIGASDSPEDFYQTLYEEIQRLFGDVGLMVALYEPLKHRIQIPYAREQGQETPLQIPPFPLGEGLLSHVLLNRKPLLIKHYTEERARELGAKTIGDPAKSWLGVPLIAGEQLIGALVLQDIFQENRFNEEDMRFVSAIATSVALLLNKVHLVARAENAYQRERLLFDISQQAQTANINDMLKTALQGLQHTLRARHGVIRLRLNPHQDDTPNDNSA